MKCWNLGDGVIGCGGTAPTDADLAEVEKFKRYLRGVMPAADVRAFAGLSLGQAAKILGIDKARLAQIEDGSASPTLPERAAMKRAYDCDFVLPGEDDAHARA